MVVLVTSKNEEAPIKDEGTRVFTTMIVQMLKDQTPYSVVRPS